MSEISCPICGFDVDFHPETQTASCFKKCCEKLKELSTEIEDLWTK